MVKADFERVLPRGQLRTKTKRRSVGIRSTRALKKKTAEVGVVAVQRRLGFVHT
jgi:hypothetical protein